MMLRKRSRSTKKESMFDSGSDSSLSSHKARNTSIFSVPGLFVEFSTKSSSELDSARSPTSPLDYKVFSGWSNAFIRSPRSMSSGIESPRKSWDCDRVGLGLVDTLADDSTNLNGKVVGGFPCNKNIIFGSKLRMSIPCAKSLLGSNVIGTLASSPKSSAESYVASNDKLPGSTHFQLASPTGEAQNGKTQSCSAEIGRGSLPTEFFYLNPMSNSEEILLATQNTGLYPHQVGDKNFVNRLSSLPVSSTSFHGFMGSLSACDIESSEDYTRIITHGPNPKTTHIFGDLILESYGSELKDFINNYKEGEQEERVSSWMVKFPSDPLPSQDNNFLSFCHFCRKKLIEGKDIYMYRGEKAFCSYDCREKEILMDEEAEKPKVESGPQASTNEADFFGTGMFVTT